MCVVLVMGECGVVGVSVVVLAGACVVLLVGCVCGGILEVRGDG